MQIWQKIGMNKTKIKLSAIQDHNGFTIVPEMGRVMEVDLNELGFEIYPLSLDEEKKMKTKENVKMVINFTEFIGKNWSKLLCLAEPIIPPVELSDYDIIFNEDQSKILQIKCIIDNVGPILFERLRNDVNYVVVENSSIEIYSSYFLQENNKIYNLVHMHINDSNDSV